MVLLLRGNVSRAAAKILTTGMLLTRVVAEEKGPDLNGRELFVNSCRILHCTGGLYLDPCATKTIRIEWQALAAILTNSSTLLCLSLIDSSAIGTLILLPPRRCRVLSEKPSIFKGTGRDGFTGLAIEYLEDLEKELNFSCGSLAEYESEESDYEGFTGLTKYLDHCAEDGDSAGCDFDMAVAGFFETDDRVDRVDFPAPYAFDRFSVAQRLDGIKNSNFGSGPLLLAPFTLPVWAGVVGLMLMHTLVTVLDTDFLPEEEEEDKEDFEAYERSLCLSIRYKLLKARILRKLRYALFHAVHSMLGTDGHESSISRGQRRSSPTRQRILWLIGVFTGLFLVLCYEASLVVQLFSDDPVSDFRSIDDVNNCRIDANDFCVPAGGAAEAFWLNNTEKAREHCRKSSVENDKPTFVTNPGRFKDNYAAGMNKVAEGECKYMMASMSTLAVGSANEYCGVLSVVGEPFVHFSVGFVLPKGSNITAPLSTETLKLHQKVGLPNLIEYGVPRECKNVLSPKKLDWYRMSIVVYATGTLQSIMLVYTCIDRRQRLGKHDNEEDAASVTDSTAVQV